MKPIQYLNQRDVADIVGMSRETIARWRDQGRLPKPDAIVGIRGARGVWLKKTIDKWLRSKTYREWVIAKRIREESNE